MRLLLVILLIYFSPSSFANDIFITQSGDRLDLDVVQEGQDHTVSGYSGTHADIQGDDNTVMVKQRSVVAADSSQVKLDVNGDNNEVFAGQGVGTFSSGYTNYTQTDSLEAGEHLTQIDVVGDDNKVYTGQRNGSGFSTVPQYDDHTITAKVYGDNNEVGMFQGHDGSKTMSLTINNDGNNVDMRQRGYDAEHSATVTLDGTAGTSLYLDQNSTTSQSYSLNQFCATAGGCSVSVTQN